MRALHRYMAGATMGWVVGAVGVLSEQEPGLQGVPHRGQMCGLVQHVDHGAEPRLLALVDGLG